MNTAQFHFHSPVKAHFGAGSRNLVTTLLRKYDRIGIVSGKTSLDATGMRSFLAEKLEHQELFFFCEVEPNPSITTVVRGGQFMRENDCQAVVAVGGGSALDAGKAIAALSTNKEDFHSLLELDSFPVQPLPIIAIPTTCGTGSEMNHYSIITDTDERDKLNFSADNTFPSHALLCSSQLAVWPCCGDGGRPITARRSSRASPYGRSQLRAHPETPRSHRPDASGRTHSQSRMM